MEVHRTLGNGYVVLFGPDLVAGPGKEREYHEVILQKRLQAAVDRLNPTIPADLHAEIAVSPYSP